MKSITFKTRNGGTITKEFASEEEAISRFDFLFEQEVKTRKIAPTDSGDVRFNYNQEATAIFEAFLRNH